MPDILPIDRDLGPASGTRLTIASAGSTDLAAAALAVADLTVEKPDELTWWDWTVFLLHTAAEVEHALMVQYLYAAYSLADGGFQGPAVPPNAAQLTGGWRETIVGIAREEMAHLLTVQNLLRFVGGPLNFEREDFPFLAFLYPFALRLEPLTKTSLAKYVAAEMPAAPGQPPALIQEIVARATSATGGMAINRVGILYDAAISIFQDETKLRSVDLRPETADAVQAGPNDWLGFGSLLVRAVRSRAEAIDALVAIAEQGEGSMTPAPGSPPSHFDRLLQIYSAFPETELQSGLATWIPTRLVPLNPNTLHRVSTDADMEAGRITHPTTRLWAHLFNVRYRMLLLDLAHALHRSGPYLEADGEPTLRGRLRDGTFLEMRGARHAGLRGIAKMLTTLPLKETSGPARAGPPFELPYTLALPDGERDRWRLHLALIDSSRDLVAKIVAVSGMNEVLTELTQLDEAARVVVEAQLSA